jgi:hypothetical protein
VKAVTYTSPLDGKSHWLDIEAWKQAIRDGKTLAKYYLDRQEKPTSEQLKLAASARARAMFEEPDDPSTLDFYAVTILGAAILDLEGLTDPNAQVTEPAKP